MPVKYIAALALALILLDILYRLLRHLTPQTTKPPARPPGAFANLTTLFPRYPKAAALAILTAAFLALYPGLDLVFQAAGVAPEFVHWDFGVFLRAGEVVFTDEPLYVLAEDGTYHGSYLYPPVYALLFRPLLGLGFDGAVATWMVGTVLALWLALQWLIGSLGLRLRLWERGVLLMAVVGFHPLLFSIKQGQVSAFMATMVTLAAVALVRGLPDRAREPGWLRRRLSASSAPTSDSSDSASDSASSASASAPAPDPDPASSSPSDSNSASQRSSVLDSIPTGLLARLASGLFTTIPATMKLPYAPIGAHLLQDRDRFLGALATGVGLVAVSFLVLGLDPHQAYLDVLLWGKSGSSRHPTLWMPAYYQPLFALGGFRTAFRVLLVLVVAALAVLTRNRGADLAAFALGVTAMPLIAPRADLYYLSALLPAVVVLLAIEFERDGKPLLPVLGILLVHVHSYGLRLQTDYLLGVVPFHDLYFAAIPLLQPALWGNGILFALALWRTSEYVEGLNVRLPWLAPDSDG